MSKIDLNNVAGGFNLSKINDNFQKIETALNDGALWRDNPTGEPNQMKNDLDMNGHRIYNLPAPVAENEPARYKEIQDVRVEIDQAHLDAQRAKDEADRAKYEADRAAAGSSDASNLKVFSTKADADTAAATLPNGQEVIARDEQKRYKVHGGVLVFVENLARLETELTRDEGAVGFLRGLQATQIYQYSAATDPKTVNQGLYINEAEQDFYITYGVNGGADALVRKLDNASVVQSEFTLVGIGSAGSLVPVTDGGAAAFLIGGGYAAGGKVIVVKSGAIDRQVNIDLDGRAGGATIAVDSLYKDKCAFYYYKADGSYWIAHSIPLADVLAGTGKSQVKNSFSFTLPAGVTSIQTIAYYAGDIFVLCGDDAISSEKYILRYRADGVLLEKLSLSVDKAYGAIEGSIREPEGLCITHNPRTAGPNIYVSVCFGSHSAAIIRVYKLSHSGQGTAVTVEGFVGRVTGNTDPLRVVDLPIMFTKSGASWIANNGATISSIGKQIVQGGVTANALDISFNIHKPYYTLIGWSLTPSKHFVEANIVPIWEAVFGGSTSRAQKVVFYNRGASAYVDPATVASGAFFCLTLRVAYSS